MKYNDKTTRKIGLKHQERINSYEPGWYSKSYSDKPRVSQRDMYIFRCSKKIKDRGWWNSLTKEEQEEVFLKHKKYTMDELIDMYPGDTLKKRNGRIDEILK